MSLAISSTLVFLIALATPGSPAAAGSHSWAAFVGGLWGVALQVANWPFRPQHPLRRSVSGSWLAVSDLFEAMAPAEENDANQRYQSVLATEAALRTTLDKTYAALAAGALAALADSTEHGDPMPARLQPLLEKLEAGQLPVPPAGATSETAQRDHWVFDQLMRAATELSAMLLVTLESAPARNADAPAAA